MREFLRNRAEVLAFVVLVAAGVASVLTLLAGVGAIVYVAVVWEAPLW